MILRRFPSSSLLYYILLLAGAVFAYETVQDAALIARQLVQRASVGTMATVLPSDHPTAAGQPFPLQEYYASCHSNGSLALLFLPISRHSQNILKSPSHSASISVWSEPPSASGPRVSLIGNVTIFYHPDEVPIQKELKACYLLAHPDARRWLPDDDEGAHISYWARFDPHDIYFVGGFGDEHYIGYVPLLMYQGAFSLGEGYVQHRFDTREQT